MARDEVVGVGLGLPGPVHRPSGSWATPRSSRLGGYAGGGGGRRGARLPVEVENDANLGALGEWMWGAGRGAAHMAYVKAATGIGAGFIVANAPYVGAGGTAGELGHTVVDPGGPICRCGNRGCLETFAGRAGDPQLAARRPRRRLDPAGRGRARRARRRGLHARDRRCRHRDRHRRGHALQPLQPAPGRRRRRPRRGGRAAARAAARVALRGAIRSAAQDVTIVQGELGDRAEVLGAVALVLGRGAEATTA